MTWNEEDLYCSGSSWEGLTLLRYRCLHLAPEIWKLAFDPSYSRCCEIGQYLAQVGGCRNSVARSLVEVPEEVDASQIEDPRLSIRSFRTKSQIWRVETWTYLECAMITCLQVVLKKRCPLCAGCFGGFHFLDNDTLTTDVWKVDGVLCDTRVNWHPEVAVAAWSVYCRYCTQVSPVSTQCHSKAGHSWYSWWLQKLRQ